MKKLFIVAIALSPVVASAQANGGLLNFIDNLVNIASFLIPLLIAIAVLVFFWGIVKFMSHAGDEKAREEGKQVIIWGMVALFVMVAIWGLVGFLQSIFDLSAAPPGQYVLPPTTIPI